MLLRFIPTIRDTSLGSTKKHRRILEVLSLHRRDAHPSNGALRSANLLCIAQLLPVACHHCSLILYRGRRLVIALVTPGRDFLMRSLSLKITLCNLV